MPPYKSRKGMNLHLIDYKRAQKLAKQMTEKRRSFDKRSPEVTMRQAVSIAIEEELLKYGIHIDE